MFGKLNEEENAKFLPDVWKEEVTLLLEKTYAGELKASSKKIDVYGLTYPNEVVLIVSHIDQEDDSISPLTCFLSAELKKNSDVEKILSVLVNSVGVFLDEFFETEQWDEYSSVWTEVNKQGVDFFYRISRENVGLTIQANNLLNQ